MENNIIRLEDVVQEDMTLDDAEQRIRERPLDGYSLQAWDRMIGELDAMWYTQTQDSIKNLVPFGRMRLNSMLNEMDKEGQLSAAKNQVSIWAERAAAAALSSHKEFDMKVYCPVRELNEEERMRFNGWNLVHFEKIYKFQDNVSYYIIFKERTKGRSDKKASFSLPFYLACFWFFRIEQSPVRYMGIQSSMTCSNF